MSRCSGSSALVLFTVALWLVSAGCGQAQSPAAAQAATRSDPVAIVNGVAISRADLEADIAPQISKLEEQAYALRRQQLDELIAAQLLAAEARKRGVTVEALIEQEVTAKVKPVTDADVQEFVAANRARLPADPASVEPQIRQHLDDERRGARREAFIEALKADATIAVHLEAPVVYRASIDTAGAPSRGPQNAPVTIVEFSDFHCPFCRRVQPTLEQVLARYPSQVQLVYKHFPLDSLHPEARRAAEASWCAQQQDKFWPYHDRLYEAGADASAATLGRVARESGLDVQAFEQCLASDEPAAVVQAHVDEGTKYGVTGTPGFFVNGRFLSGAQPLDAFVRVIEEELAGAN